VRRSTKSRNGPEPDYAARPASDLRTTPNLDHAAVIAEIGARLESEVTVQFASLRNLSRRMPSELIVRAALEIADASAGVESVTRQIGRSSKAFLRSRSAR